MNNQATVKLVLDPQSKQLEKKIKLRVIFDRKMRYYITPSNTLLTEEEFQNESLKKTKEALKTARRALTLAEEIADKLKGDFTFEEFKAKYDSVVFNKITTRKTTDVSAVFADYCREKKLKLSTKVIYDACLKWIIDFRGNVDIRKVDQKFVKDWAEYIEEEHKERKGKPVSPNTMSIYKRDLRSICNYAIEQGYISKNPLAGQTLNSTRREKRALTLEDFTTIIRYQTTDGTMMFGRDFFLLSFLLAGSNLGDIFSFKNADLNGIHLKYVRKKTETSSRRLEIDMDVPDKAIELMKKYGRICRTTPNAYIFPFFEGITGEHTLLEKKKSLIKKVDKGLKRICDATGIEKITSYHARHTYATFARDMGKLTTEQIQRLLGHASSKTTQIYLDSLTQGVKDQNKKFLEDILNSNTPAKEKEEVAVQEQDKE